jgi:thymidine kinase
MVHPETELVAIDEAHFFDIGLVPVVEELRVTGSP